MLKLYHNLLSTCSQKVRLALAEKGLEFESAEIDLLAGQQHDPGYVKLNPNHVVPTLVDGERVFIESTLINEYLDDAFPDPALHPPDAAGRHTMRSWTKKVDEKVHPYAGVVTYAVGVRPLILRRSAEDIEATIQEIPDLTRREARRSVIEHGVKAPEFAPAISAFVGLLDAMDEALAAGPWLAGSTFSLADIAVLPYVLRLDHLAMGPLLAASARPRLAEWYERIRARAAFDKAVASWLPQAMLEVFHAHGQEVWADVEPLTR